MSLMFYGCSSLKSFPDISKWDILKITNISYIFRGCKSLNSLPNISIWNTSNLKDFGHMFDGCKDNLNIPNKFKNKEKEKIQMFRDLYGLLEEDYDDENLIK